MYFLGATSPPFFMPKKIDESKIFPFLGKLKDKDVAKQFGISITTVRDMRRRNNIPPAKSQGKWEIVDPLLGTRPDRELANVFKLSQSSIVQRRQKLGISPYDKSRQRINWTEIDPFLGKVSDTELAQKNEVASSSITRRRNGLNLPPFCPAGQPQHQSTPKINAGLSLSVELVEAISNLPQVKTPLNQDGWSRSYFVEQALRNVLGLPADYSLEDIKAIARGSIVV